ncbi:hypothetical protein DYH09_28805 [bacterium CPR1]|nr:hypothetical protein [bacterium CPR1]
MQISALAMPAARTVEPREHPTDPVLERFQDRYDSLTGRSVLVEEALTWTAAASSAVTMGSLMLGFKPVASLLGPIGLPLAATVACFGFAYGSIRMQKREREKRWLQESMQLRREELAEQAERNRELASRLVTPGRGSLEVTEDKVKVGPVQVKRRQKLQ